MNSSAKPPIIINTGDNGRYTLGLAIGLVEPVTSHIRVNATVDQPLDDAPNLVSPAVGVPAGAPLSGSEVLGGDSTTNPMGVLNPQVMNCLGTWGEGGIPPS